MSKYYTEFQDKDKFLADYEKLGFAKIKYSNSDNYYYKKLLLKVKSSDTDTPTISLIVHSDGRISIYDEVDAVAKYTINNIIEDDWSWSLVGVIAELVSRGYITAPDGVCEYLIEREVQSNDNE